MGISVMQSGTKIDASKIAINQQHKAEEKTPSSQQADTETNQNTKVLSYENAEPLELESFPHKKNGSTGVKLKPTIANLQHLLRGYHISCRYDVIKKKFQHHIPGHAGCEENATESSLAIIQNLSALNDLPSKNIEIYLAQIADNNPVNHVADWITRKPWDGQDRLPDFYNTLTVHDNYPDKLKEILLLRWLLSSVAAVFDQGGFRTRGVLTLQGPQSIGKTAWVRSLINDANLCSRVVKLDHHLDPGNKDSLISAISHWIVEIGELDSSLKKDVARLKGFISSDSDKVRRPYGRADSEYPRRTVFIATVNEDEFLVDSTGNTRFWTIPVIAINYVHGIDMQQLFAQVYDAYLKGEQWWLLPEEEEQIERINNDHRKVSAIRERVLNALDMENGYGNEVAMNPTRLLQAIGIHNPTNHQCKECGSVLREVIGNPKKINGTMKWYVCIKPEILRANGTSSELYDDY